MRPFAIALAGVVQSDGGLAIGEPGEEGAAAEALKIENDIEAHLADGTNARPYRGPPGGLALAFAIENKQAGEVRVVFQQRGEARLNPPEDFAVRQMAFEHSEDGEGLDHVAEGAGFEVIFRPTAG